MVGIVAGGVVDIEVTALSGEPLVAGVCSVLVSVGTSDTCCSFASVKICSLLVRPDGYRCYRECSTRRCQCLRGEYLRVQLFMIP